MTLSELFYLLFWHNSSVLEVTYYAHNNASIMWKSLLASQTYRYVARAEKWGGGNIDRRICARRKERRGGYTSGVFGPGIIHTNVSVYYP